MPCPWLSATCPLQRAPPPQDPGKAVLLLSHSSQSHNTVLSRGGGWGAGSLTLLFPVSEGWDFTHPPPHTHSCQQLWLWQLLNGFSRGQPGSGELSAGLGPCLGPDFAAHSLISLWFPKVAGFLRAGQDPHNSFMGPRIQSAGLLFARMHFCHGCQPNCAPWCLVSLPQLQAL